MLSDPEGTIAAPIGAPARAALAWRVVRVASGTAFLQALLQLLGVLAGLVALRWMSVEDYAQYSLAFAVATTFGVIVDVGLSGSIVALVGERADDPDAVDEYSAAARRLRNRLFAFAAVPVAVLVWVLLSGRGWPVETRVGLLAAIFAGVWFQGQFTTTGSVLLVRRRLGAYYRPQIGAAGGRLGAFGVLQIAGALSGVAGTVVNAVYQAVIALRVRAAAARELGRGLRPRAAVETRRELWHYVQPIWPGALFFAFQSQIALIIVGVVGSDRVLAEVGALGRLSQLFMVLTALNIVLVQPYLARSPLQRVPRRYLGLLVAATAGSAALTALAFAWPTPLLLVLGETYDNLDVEIGIMVAAASISFVASLLYTMNMARRWVFGWATALNIGVVIAAQLLAAVAFDLTTTRGALLFTLVTAAVAPLPHLVSAAYAWRRAPEGRRLDG